jgi:hypothetical protein
MKNWLVERPNQTGWECVEAEYVDVLRSGALQFSNRNQKDLGWFSSREFEHSIEIVKVYAPQAWISFEPDKKKYE